MNTEVTLHPLKLKKELIESLGILILGGTINLILWGGNIFDAEIKWILTTFILSGIFWVFLWKGNQYIFWVLDGYFPWIKFPIKRLVYSILTLIAYVFVIVYAFDVLVDMFIVGKTFIASIQEINQTSLTVSILMTFGISTVLHGRGFLLSWRQAAIDNEKLMTEQVFTQFQSLKNQVNPHFLFNSLNALSSLVYEDQGKAVAFIKKLSQVYRYVLDKKDEEIVPVADELDFLNHFIFLQKIRFGDNLKFEVSGSPQGYLPPLALQLLVENAIKHNVVSDAHPLHISVAFDEVHCTVINNVKAKLSKDNTGIGLNNLKDRYRYLSDQRVDVANEAGQFKVVLPILKLEEEA